MYKSETPTQITLNDFNQMGGVQLDKDNEWVMLAELIPWTELEAKYAALFPGERGNVAVPFRQVFGSLIIQKRLKLSDRKTIQAIRESPYLQYFMGLPGFQHEAPFNASGMVAYRRRISMALVNECNDAIIAEMVKADEARAEEAPKKPGRKKQQADAKEEGSENEGTQILDATCAPSNIKFPQDYALLNEAREQLERMIDWFYKTYRMEEKPRTYRRLARKDYLSLAKRRRRDEKQIRATVRKMLGYVKRDLGYLEAYMSQGYALDSKKTDRYLTILTLYGQQYYMWKNRTHSVRDRIVSISQPWVRPVVRGKAKAPVEFGAKLEASIDEKGYGRLERVSFDPFNESTSFMKAMDGYRARTGHYPKRALVDQIYRTQENRRFCKDNGIRMSGPKLGRPSKDSKMNAKDKKMEYRDNVDRIEVERFFSLAKVTNGMGLIMTKLQETTMTSIALSILVNNLFRGGSAVLFFPVFYIDCDGEPESHFAIFEDDEVA